jgi:phage shock protein A
VVVVGLLCRLSCTTRAWLNALLNRAADPVAELDSSYEQLGDELQAINRGIVDLDEISRELARRSSE